MNNTEWARDIHQSMTPTVDAEYLAAAERVKRYNNESLECQDKWCDLYDQSQQYGNDLALLADFACAVILGKDGGA